MVIIHLCNAYIAVTEEILVISCKFNGEAVVLKVIRPHCNSYTTSLRNNDRLT